MAACLRAWRRAQSAAHAVRAGHLLLRRGSSPLRWLLRSPAHYLPRAMHACIRPAGRASHGAWRLAGASLHAVLLYSIRSMHAQHDDEAEAAAYAAGQQQGEGRAPLH